MAFPDIPAITAVTAVPMTPAVAALSAREGGAQGRARHYARTARAGKPAGDGTLDTDSAQISVEGLRAELQAILGDIEAIAAVEGPDPQRAKRVAALAAQAATVHAEIAEAQRLAPRARPASG